MAGLGRVLGLFHNKNLSESAKFSIRTERVGRLASLL